MPLDESEYLRKKPQQSRSRAVVSAILEAADQLLTRVGDPEKVSLEGVARRAGIGIGSLYDYFSNREDVLGAFLSRLTDANFVELEKQVNATNAVSFDEALPLIVDATMKLYLAHPDRTRATIAAIARLGWMRPVVAERDRFAGVLAARLRVSFPELDPDKVQLTTEVLCDSVIGVVAGELWRTRTVEQHEKVRAEVVSMVKAAVQRLRST
ncbi:MAG: TetR/AcrR family transcriptional regulator [Archangium sp.]|nr:TetR/AcrR family transcriptional regulator [Archangium sp.]